MQPFKHVNVTTVADAVAAITDPTVRVIAGGTDLLNALEVGIYSSTTTPPYPATLVNLKTIPNMDQITVDNGTLKVGALAKLADVASSSVVQGSYSMLSQAAASVATPNVRNMGTLGGNLCQSVECWYYRFPDRLGGYVDCHRKTAANPCYAAAGINTYHSIFGAPKGCFSVYPSDTATALLALDASVVTTSRTIPIASFFDALTGTVLNTGEIVTEIDVPTPAANTTQTFIKNAQRKAIDFAVVSVAAMLTMSGSKCTAARIVLGGVAPTPLESTAAENAIVGQTVNSTTAAAAASAAVASATPLTYNTYKVPTLQSVLTQAILAAAPS
ncbi:MAG: FAD binding domain-containing protein [Nitrososphaerales archaeon]|jgi:xanthine dehydrogenase YagS FAD-binding subunit